MMTFVPEFLWPLRIHLFISNYRQIQQHFPRNCHLPMVSCSAPLFRIIPCRGQQLHIARRVLEQWLPQQPQAKAAVPPPLGQRQAHLLFFPLLENHLMSFVETTCEKYQLEDSQTVAVGYSKEHRLEGTLDFYGESVATGTTSGPIPFLISPALPYDGGATSEQIGANLVDLISRISVLLKLQKKAKNEKQRWGDSAPIQEGQSPSQCVYVFHVFLPDDKRAGDGQFEMCRNLEQVLYPYSRGRHRQDRVVGEGKSRISASWNEQEPVVVQVHRGESRTDVD